jgi:hypothetical protein
VCGRSRSDILISDLGLSYAQLDELIENISFDVDFEYGDKYFENDDDDFYYYSNINDALLENLYNVYVYVYIRYSIQFD